MPLRNTPDHWGGAIQLLHWGMAALVLALIVLGWVMIYYPLSPTQFRLYAWHKSLGMVLLGLLALRLLWRILDPPPHAAAVSPWEHRLAVAAHLTLYVLLVGLIVTGYLINSATNFPLSVFGLFVVPNLTGESPSLKALSEWLHLLLFWLLAVALAGHVGAALRHHFLLHDEVLRRMLPWRRRGRS